MEASYWDGDAVCEGLRAGVASAASVYASLLAAEGLLELWSGGGWEAAALVLEAAGVEAPVYRASLGDCAAVLAVNSALSLAARLLGLSWASSAR